MPTTYPISQAYTDGQVLSASNVNQIAGGVNDLAALQINAQTGTSYTLVLGDAAKTITLTNAAAITLNVPTNASVAFAIGTQILLYQGGAGQVTVAAVTPGTTTIRANASRTKINGQYGMACLMKLATDEWVLFGNTAV
jgi:hypothetical protein